MAIPGDLPVVDHHCHLSPGGEGVEAARRFARAGGTHLFLATQQYGKSTPARLEEYREQFETTEKLARAVEEEAGVKAYVVVAPYPVDLLRQADASPPDAAVRLQKDALDLAGRWVREGRAVALGEVGRPHFPYPEALRPSVEEVFHHALEVARDAGCPVVVHSEDLDAAGYRALDALASRVGVPPRRLVKHYARALVPREDGVSAVPSYLARRPLVEEALASPGPWFLETDFLDDPARPGAVLDLATVPRRAAEIARRGPQALESLRIPFQRSIEEVYGFRPEVPGVRRG